MKKTVIGIKGAPDMGKTSAIKKIVELFPLHFPDVKIEIIHEGNDICVLITLGDIKIGIESAGDPGSRQAESVRMFVEKGCTIIIVATRTKGDTIKIVKSLHESEGYDVVLTSHYHSKQKPSERSNELFAKHLLLLLDEIIQLRY